MPIEAAALESWTTSLVRAWGYGVDDSRFLARTLLDANLRGIDSHGVIRLPAYERRIAAGLVRPDAAPVLSGAGSVVTVDANGAAGQIAARKAAEAALTLSRSTGVAVATVRGSTHFGTAGFYARWMAAHRAVGIVASNSEPIVVPYGGREVLLGTNPIAFAAPADDTAVSVDMATSTSAMGRVMVARAAGAPVPDTWGVDARGRPTTDAAAVEALLPLGGPKGYGLGFAIEILAGVLSGAAVSHELGNMYTDFTKPQNIGHWLLAIDIAHFTSYDSFVERLRALIEAAHAIAPAPDFEGVLVPGEPEEHTSEQRLRDGIPLAAATVDELHLLGARHGVAFPGTRSS
ncbi:Ldh family oxidoreductase [Kribbella sp. NPDC000426]|uniref:Ldh family oxidoreductase n=1 Tax=Kribbella sp. NPDC000426 TaxID=3154255 RepID=UPI003330FF59